ncbi:hypothetical protein [Halorubrum sp. DM2]|uniref:hypothetical protein n=1 Tax=Halorubrum sp. DM2 TaxID=2527867 RepID=UPI0031F31502
MAHRDAGGAPLEFEVSGTYEALSSGTEASTTRAAAVRAGGRRRERRRVGLCHALGYSYVPEAGPGRKPPSRRQGPP